MDIYMSELRIMDQELEISGNQEQEISETQGKILEAENIMP